MAVILIGGEKGGTGKSTVATNLAIMASYMNRDCMLLDCDKQKSSHDFISHRNELKLHPTPPCVQIRGKFLHFEIEDLAKRYEDVIIDAGGQDSVEMRSAMAAPSVQAMYIPVQASTFDLQTLVTLDELVNFSRAYNQNLQAYVLINRAATHQRITKSDEAVEFIEESLPNLKVCKTRLYERIAYQYAVGKGQSVVEFEAERLKEMPAYRAQSYSAKATEEICNLYESVFNRLFDKATLSNIRA